MPRCPFANWLPISGSSGPHLSGPFKIIHHTTEGRSAQDAFDAFRANRSDPHFTVDGTGIFQHVDTEVGARALRNESGGVETNRDSAVQIELVGFAHLPKDTAALENVARLCRWIELTHGVPRVWPSGLPRPAKNGKDPGGHNRNATTWNDQGGHYGHCHVPENTHWDPGYTKEEVNLLMNAAFDADGRATSPRRAAKGSGRRRASTSRTASKGKTIPRSETSTMPDHGIVPTGSRAYIGSLSLWPAPVSMPARPRIGRTAAARRRAATPAPAYDASVNVGSLLSFVDGLSAQERNDVLYSIQLAQRGASGEHDRFFEIQAWYRKYVEILENLGWVLDQFAFTHFEQEEEELRMDQAALAIIAAIATQNQLAVLQQSITALSKLADGDGTIRLFDLHSSLQGSGNFQLGTVQRSENGALTMALGAFYCRSVDERKRFLFFKWGAQEVNFWTAAQRMTLNSDFYARQRDAVVAKLADSAAYISGLRLGSR